jgi:hypothetical protein
MPLAGSSDYLRIDIHPRVDHIERVHEVELHRIHLRVSQRRDVQSFMMSEDICRRCADVRQRLRVRPFGCHKWASGCCFFPVPLELPARNIIRSTFSLHAVSKRCQERGVAGITVRCRGWSMVASVHHMVDLGCTG